MTVRTIVAVNETQSPIAITAYAANCGLGASTDDVLKALEAGTRGLRAVPFEVPFEAITGTMPGALPPLEGPLAQFDSRTSRLALAIYPELAPAVDAAKERWGADRVALVLGTSTGGILETERAYEHWLEGGAGDAPLPADYNYLTHHPFHAFAEALGDHAGIDGPRYVVSTACSSSAKVFASARRLIALDLADAVIVGGVDGLSHTTVRGFHSLGVMAPEPSRPFGADRPGMNVGEAAALLLLERDGEALAWLAGVGESSDAYHMSSPQPEGLGALAAMKQALAQGGVGPEVVDYVNAHGTGTKYNDASESKAINALFGESVPVVSTKAYTGHTLGACGALEAIFAIAALREGWIPAAIGSEEVDPEVSLFLPQEVLRKEVRYVLSNAFAFGGNNCSVLLKAAEESA